MSARSKQAVHQVLIDLEPLMELERELANDATFQTATAHRQFANGDLLTAGLELLTPDVIRERHPSAKRVLRDIVAAVVGACESHPQRDWRCIMTAVVRAAGESHPSAKRNVPVNAELTKLCSQLIKLALRHAKDDPEGIVRILIERDNRALRSAEIKSAAGVATR